VTPSSGGGYSIDALSEGTNNHFIITKAAGSPGAFTRSCTAAGTGGCPGSGGGTGTW
jgi:hypothetical protein